MKLAAIMGVMQMLVQVKDISSSFNHSLKADTVEGPKYRTTLDYPQCCFVVLVYRLVAKYNSLEPKQPLSDEDMAKYFNHIFDLSVPLARYQKVWRKFKPNMSLL